MPTEYTYRVWLLPEIIGSAVHLKANEGIVEHIMYGLCPNMTAHDAPLALCLSKSQTSLLDVAARLALREAADEHVVGPFHKYPDCGDEISFDTVGYNIPCTTLSRVGEMFPFYHSSADTLENFLQPDWQLRHSRFVAVLVRALQFIEQNASVVPQFKGNPCLSNPALDLYLSPANINNLRVPGAMLRKLGGGELDGRNFMEFFLDAIARDGVSLLEIADAADVPFDFVNSYARKFADRGLARLEMVNRRHRVPVVATASLISAGLV